VESRAPSEPPSPAPTPSPAAPWRSEVARAWALSAAWGWLVLLGLAAVAIAIDAHALRDALDLSLLFR
jgi:hypothetical protein